MATNIKTDLGPTEGTSYSTTLAAVSNIDIQAIPDATATGQRRFTVQRKTENGEWRNVKANGEPVIFRTLDAENEGVNLLGVNAAYLRVKIDVLAGCTENVNLEYESV